MSADQTHVVVLNQHGDNRGDEAAMRAMVATLDERLGPARFTVVHQFADRDSEVTLDHPVRYLPLRIGVVELGRLTAWSLLAGAGFRADRVAGPRGRRIIDAVDEADLVVSAPGGPYFGDLYAGHEVAHWLLIWIAHLAGTPIGLFAPSCGPFENRLLNPLRRRGYRWFDRVVLREARSAAMLRDLTGIEAEVTIDAALAQSVGPADRSTWCGTGEQLVVVAVRDPGEAGPPSHDDAIVAAVDALARDQPTSVVLLPQLHGTTHRDAPYLQTLAHRMTSATAARVAPETFDAPAQRAVVAAADLVVAGRYHPAVFSISAATPVLVIAYEHKAMGVAEAAGIEEWACWLDDLDADSLAERALALRARSAAVRTHLQGVAPGLATLAGRTATLMAELVD